MPKYRVTDSHSKSTVQKPQTPPINTRISTIPSFKRHPPPINTPISTIPSFKRHPSFIVFHTSSFTRRPSHVVLHTSSFTRRPSHVVLHTSSFTRRPSLVIPLAPQFSSMTPVLECRTVNRHKSILPTPDFPPMDPVLRCRIVSSDHSILKTIPPLRTAFFASVEDPPIDSVPKLLKCRSGNNHEPVLQHPSHSMQNLP